jgi:hypothetical protein
MLTDVTVARLMGVWGNQGIKGITYNACEEGLKAE